MFSEELIHGISVGFALGLTVGFFSGVAFAVYLPHLLRPARLAYVRLSDIWVGHLRDRS